jgi:hypothetical protein
MELNYRCPECGGKLIVNAGLLLECEGCTAIYEPKDPILTRYAYFTPKKGTKEEWDRFKEVFSII